VVELHIKTLENMKILYYKKGIFYLPGIFTDQGIIEIPADDKEELRYASSAINNADLAYFRSLIAKKDDVTLLHEEDLEIGPCVMKPSKIICIGLNYQRHAQESNMEPPKIPILFNKFNNTLVEYNGDIALGQEGKEFDYEVELGVVIGKTCKNVSVESALEHIMGYCTANDLSCRDLQFKTPQWLLGKSLDKFLPLGKYLVTSDEITDCQNLSLRCYLNGELRQDSNTADMIFSVAEIIAFISRHMTLETGDLILTGTPEGVIMGMDEKIWLRTGDKVKVEIEQLGATINKMV
jgi:2-keto-4-pentenoate hydratase/2-oxohepta-3-ene-1,7-dioic acid hydratase in catechol pathway